MQLRGGERRPPLHTGADEMNVDTLCVLFSPGWRTTGPQRWPCKPLTEHWHGLPLAAPSLCREKQPVGEMKETTGSNTNGSTHLNSLPGALGVVHSDGLSIQFERRLKALENGEELRRLLKDIKEALGGEDKPLVERG